MAGWTANVPLVPRAARWGGLLWLVGAAQFVVLGLVLTLAEYPGHSVLHGHLSDLGSPRSPLAWVFNGSIELLGLAGGMGVLLVHGSFFPRRSATVARSLMFLASLAAILVGVFPESTPTVSPIPHALAAATVFVGGGLGLLLLSRAMRRDPRWIGLPGPTGLAGLVTLAATVLYVSGIDPGIGSGGMEAVIVAPLLLWLMVAGARLAGRPAFASRTIVTT